MFCFITWVRSTVKYDWSTHVCCERIELFCEKVVWILQTNLMKDVDSVVSKWKKKQFELPSSIYHLRNLKTARNRGTVFLHIIRSTIYMSNWFNKHHNQYQHACAGNRVKCWWLDAEMCLINNQNIPCNWKYWEIWLELFNALFIKECNVYAFTLVRYQPWCTEPSTRWWNVHQTILMMPVMSNTALQNDSFQWHHQVQVQLAHLVALKENFEAKGWFHC